MTRIARALTIALVALFLALGVGRALTPPGYHQAGEIEWCSDCTAP